MNRVATQSCVVTINYFIYGFSLKDCVETYRDELDHDSRKLFGLECERRKVLLLGSTIMKCVATRSCAETFNDFIFSSSSKDDLDTRTKVKREGWKLFGFGRENKVLSMDGILMKCVATRSCVETFNISIFSYSPKDGVETRKNDTSNIIFNFTLVPAKLNTSRLGISYKPSIETRQIKREGWSLSGVGGENKVLQAVPV